MSARKTSTGPRKAAKKTKRKPKPSAGAWEALESVSEDVSGGALDVARSLLAWGEAWSSGAPGTAREILVGLERVARRQAALAPVLRIANDLLVEI